MLAVEHVRELIVRPTLQYLDMWSPAAEELMLGTAAQESRFTFLKQLGSGPALGLYQVEPATHKDIWNTYLNYKDELADKVKALASRRFPEHFDEELIFNLRYATAIARIKYWRVPKPLPNANDIYGLAKYWKEHYNTYKGDGEIKEWMHNYQELVL